MSSAAAYPLTTIDGTMGELEPTRAAPLQATTPWRVVLEVYLAGRDSEHTRRAYERHITIALEAIGVATLADLNGILLSRWRDHIKGSALGGRLAGAAPGRAAQLLEMESHLRRPRAAE